MADLLVRLRTLCPDFATIEHGLTSSADPVLPAAIVMPMAMKAAESQLLEIPLRSQAIVQTFSIFILLKRQQDTLLSSKADDMDFLCAQLRAALCGWQVDAYHAPMNLAGGQLAQYQTGISCWREDYTAESELRIIANA